MSIKMLPSDTIADHRENRSVPLPHDTLLTNMLDECQASAGATVEGSPGVMSNLR
jgi:hypothetical protein